jgi:hypothetical protein
LSPREGKALYALSVFSVFNVGVIISLYHVHFQITMRSILIALLVAKAVFVCATGNGCLDKYLEELATGRPCGDKDAISKCLGAGLSLGQSDRIQHCFVAGGCDEADAMVGAAWSEDKCPEYGDSDIQELRRRETQSTITETRTAESTASIPSRIDANTTSKPSSPRAAQTISLRAASSTTSQSSATPAIVTRDASTTTPLVCFTTTMITTSYCSVSVGKTICNPTITASPTCAPGIICQTDSEGHDICMRRDDHITLAGIVIIAVFSACIIGFTISMFISKALERRARKRQQLQRTAIATGFYGDGGGRAMADVEAVKGFSNQGQSEANLPLISSEGRSNEYNEQYDGPRHPTTGGSNTMPLPPPTLHRGFEALQ